MRRLQAGQTDGMRSAGPQYLLFECGGVSCMLPLEHLREVLNDIPRTIPLPNSPDWLLGIFPIRTEMLGLVDPMPALLGQFEGTGGSEATADLLPGHARTSVLVIGTGERALALAVDVYGDMTTIQSHELETTPEAIEAARVPILPRYIAAIYKPVDTDRCYVMLHAGRLLSDLVSALQEADEAYG
jgi:chemotaxis signal transduction protein